VSFSEFGKLPCKSLPTEILLLMRDQICKELDRRGHVGVGPDTREIGGGLFGRRNKELKEAKGWRFRLRELDALMEQDWSDLFPAGSEDRRFYVYAHVDPKKAPIKKIGGYQLHMPGTPFYIGKGCGDRAWDLNRNEGHGVQLRHLKRQGVAASEIVCLVRENLTEREALEIESKLIYFFGTKFEAGGKGILVNLSFPARPVHAVETRDRPKIEDVSRRLGLQIADFEEREARAERASSFSAAWTEHRAP